MSLVILFHWRTKTNTINKDLTYHIILDISNKYLKDIDATSKSTDKS